MLFAPKMNEENHVGMKLLKRYLIEFNEEIILSIILPLISIITNKWYSMHITSPIQNISKEDNTLKTEASRS